MTAARSSCSIRRAWRKVRGVDFDETEIERQLAAGAEQKAEAARETTLLLFRTLDGARRAVPVGLVERIEDVPAAAIGFSAGKLRLALDGRILPLAGCSAAPETEKLRILRLTDGDTEIAYGFAEVIDIRSLVLELQQRARARRGGRRLPCRRHHRRADRPALAVRAARRCRRRPRHAAGLRAARRAIPGSTICSAR